jgi:hypothetical protein
MYQCRQQNVISAVSSGFAGPSTIGLASSRSTWPTERDGDYPSQGSRR